MQPLRRVLKFALLAYLHKIVFQICHGRQASFAWAALSCNTIIAYVLVGMLTVSEGHLRVMYFRCIVSSSAALEQMVEVMGVFAFYTL